MDRKEILETLEERFPFENPEITLECNPGTVNREALLACREMGIRRGSLRYSVQGETIERKI